MNISVVVVSRRRPVWLARCLKAIRQLDHRSFEVVVVADPKSLAVTDCADLKTVPFDIPNISAARNFGLCSAAGDLCVFIDDDAVPEPLWLRHHEDAITHTGAVASVGYVRGRNGISFQSQVHSVDREAETHEERATGDCPHVPELQAGRALKLVGTNMAIKRSKLCEIGGFDEALRYFLDDSDISIRLAGSGAKCAVAPLAEVHHAFAPSERRTSLRAPVSLFDIGRSSAIFFRRHDSGDLDELFTRIMRRERARLERHMVAGTCEPRDIATILKTLKDGWSDGLVDALSDLSEIQPQAADFRPVHPIPPGHVVLQSRLLRRRRALARAEDVAKKSARVSLFSFSLTPVRHHVRYTETGVWLQTGGQFGRTCRNANFFKWCRFAERLKEESARVAKIRGI